MFTSIRNVSFKRGTVTFSVKHRKTIRFPKCFCMCWKRQSCLFFILIKAYFVNEWHCRGRKLALWSRGVFDFCPEGTNIKKKKKNTPGTLGTFTNWILPVPEHQLSWQSSILLLSVNAQCIKSSSIIPHYFPSNVAAYSKAIRLTVYRDYH